MVLFTTLAGAGQGLLLALVGCEWVASSQHLSMPRPLLLVGALVVLLLCGAGLIAAAFHLGHPLRAWRAVAMWRTSWLSREVIVLPSFMAVVAVWGTNHLLSATPSLPLGGLAVLLAMLLYLCTGMIYAAVKAIREWATPMTVVNFALIGIASGLTLACVLAAALAPEWADGLNAVAGLAIALAAASRGASLLRNLRLAPKTTLQSAIGVRHPRIAQKAQGAMGGSFNTREFFHGRSDAFVDRMRWTAALLGFALPCLAVAWALRVSGISALLLAALWLLQMLGLLAERWCFFAEARHPQNLYYQSVA